MKIKLWKKIVGITGILVAVVVFFLMLSVIAMRQETQTVGTVCLASTQKSVYSERFVEPYYIDEIEKGGYSSNKDFKDNFFDRIGKRNIAYEDIVPIYSRGVSFYEYNPQKDGYVWGKNYESDDDVFVRVICNYDGAYTNESFASFRQVNSGKIDKVDFPVVNRFTAIVCYFCPLYGINEEGLTVSDMIVDNGTMEYVLSSKPDITQGMAMRLMLDRAKTVDEALAILDKYNICSGDGLCHQLHITDGYGKSVCVEFDNGNLIVTPTNIVTNKSVSNRFKANDNMLEIAQTKLGEMGRIDSMNDVVEALSKTLSEGGKAETTLSTGICVDDKECVIKCFYDREFTYPDTIVDVNMKSGRVQIDAQNNELEILKTYDGN